MVKAVGMEINKWMGVGLGVTYVIVSFDYGWDIRKNRNQGKSWALGSSSLLMGKWECPLWSWGNLRKRRFVGNYSRGEVCSAHPTSEGGCLTEAGTTVLSSGEH